MTPDEIGSSNISRVKTLLREHIKSATHTLVVVGAFANSQHANHKEIGERNWQWWEIKESVAAGNKMVRPPMMWRCVIVGGQLGQSPAKERMSKRLESALNNEKRGA